MIQEIEKSKMDAVKELADTNIKISEAKNLLFKIQEDETKYLELREQKSLIRIQKSFDDSKDLLTQIHKNYEEVHKFCQTVSSYSDFLVEIHGKFQKMLELFKVKNELWDEEFEHRDSEIAGLRKKVELDQKEIEKDRAAITEATKELEVEKIKLEDRRQTLARAIKRLNEGRI